MYLKQILMVPKLVFIFYFIHNYYDLIAYCRNLRIGTKHVHYSFEPQINDVLRSKDNNFVIRN